MKSVAINGSLRSELGTKSSRHLRKEGIVPCVAYGGKENIHFTANSKEFKPLLYTPDFKLANIKIDGQEMKCIVKEVQFHPVTEQIMHVDFLVLVDGTPVKVELPVKFKGKSPGVKSGGKLIQAVRRIKVKTTPEKLVDALVLDISELELGSAIRVRDIQVVDGIEIMNEPSIPVAAVEVPRALKSEEDAEEKAAAAAAEGEGGEGEGGDAPAAEGGE